MTQLTRSTMAEFFRPNFFANTPDILHEYLQRGGRPAFEARLVLAATLSPSLRHLLRLRALRERAGAGGQRGVPRLGEVRAQAARSSTGRCCRSCKRLNAIRRANPALQRLDNLDVPRDRERVADRVREARSRQHRARLRQPRPDATREGLVHVPARSVCRRAFAVTRPAERRNASRWRTGGNYVGSGPGQSHVR